MSACRYFLVVGSVCMFVSRRLEDQTRLAAFRPQAPPRILTTMCWLYVSSRLHVDFEAMVRRSNGDVQRRGLVAGPKAGLQLNALHRMQYAMQPYYVSKDQPSLLATHVEWEAFIVSSQWQHSGVIVL